jgi:hypothetical protein
MDLVDATVEIQIELVEVMLISSQHPSYQGSSGMGRGYAHALLCVFGPCWSSVVIPLSTYHILPNSPWPVMKSIQVFGRSTHTLSNKARVRYNKEQC